jgi:hypothetical protein
MVKRDLHTLVTIQKALIIRNELFPCFVCNEKVHSFQKFHNNDGKDYSISLLLFEIFGAVFNTEFLYHK